MAKSKKLPAPKKPSTKIPSLPKPFTLPKPINPSSPGISPGGMAPSADISQGKIQMGGFNPLKGGM